MKKELLYSNFFAWKCSNFPKVTSISDQAENPRNLTGESMLLISVNVYRTKHLFTLWLNTWLGFFRDHSILTVTFVHPFTLLFFLLFINLSDTYWALVICHMLRYIIENPPLYEVLGETNVQKTIRATSCFMCYVTHLNRNKRNTICN